MSSKSKHILIVEDNPALGAVIRFNLEKAGYRVTSACNGEEALQSLRSDTFDFMVTDHQMPGLTGTELCGQIREEDRYRHMPVIMLTAKRLELELADLKERLGILDVLPKPFSPSELVQRIDEYFAVDAPTA